MTIFDIVLYDKGIVYIFNLALSLFPTANLEYGKIA